MIAPPSRGKPQDPRNEDQLDRGPIVDCPVFPQIGTAKKEKFTAGKFSGKFSRTGKK